MSIEMLSIVGGIVAVFIVLRLRSDDRVVMPVEGIPTDTDTDPIRAALLAGRKIEAIKVYRVNHDVGLREAKDAIEEIERSLSVS
jgi:hypothetical protein